MLRAATFRSNVAGTALLLVLCVLTVFPLVMLVYGSFRTAAPSLPGEWTLTGYTNAYTDIKTLETWVNSLVLATTVTLASTAMAVLFAFTVARTDAPLRGLVVPLMALIYFLPSLFFVFAWSMLGNPRAGLINVLFAQLAPGAGPLVNVYSWPGMIAVMSLTAVPFKFLLLLGAFKAMDMSLEEASRIAGAGRWKTLFLVDVPALAPTIIGVMILGFVKTLQSFEVPLILGFPAKIYVFSNRIYDYLVNYAPIRYAEAGALSVTLVLTLLALVFLQVRLLGNREFITITGKGYKPDVWRLGQLRWGLTAAIVAYALVALLLPTGQLLIGSFSPIFGIYTWDRLTLNNYQAVLDAPVVRRALTNTIWVAAGGGFVAMLLTAVLAYVVARTRYGLRRALELAAWIPWVLPGIVLGVAMLWAYAVVPGLRNLYGTPWLMLIAVIVTVIPVGVRLMAGSLVQLSSDLEESARVHGASWRKTFGTVVLPLVRPSFLYGWLVLAVMITGELSVPLLLYSTGTELFSIVIMVLQSNARPEQAAALFALVLLGITLTFTVGRLVIWLVHRAPLRAVARRLRQREPVLQPSLEAR